jgi:histone H3/H4
MSDVDDERSLEASVQSANKPECEPEEEEEEDEDIDDLEANNDDDEHADTEPLDDNEDISTGDESEQGAAVCADYDLGSESHEDEDSKHSIDKNDNRHHQLLKSPKQYVKPVSHNTHSSSAKRGRVPSVNGLTIPFRTVKKAMKLDPDTPIVQNEAAIMVTFASELFLKSLAQQSHRNARHRGRHTIRYEDIAEARTNDAALSFLETLFP